MLLGRTPEIKVLRDVVEQARAGGGAALVIRGEPGVGKTSLLDELALLADDCQVVRIEGVESELRLDFAALHRLLFPFLDRIHELPEPQRDALEAAFGLSATGRPDQFLVGLATLTLLGDPERIQPLLILVDDAHWLDDESLTALVFVGRRLQGDGVALVFAVRDFFAEQGSTRGLPELRVTGLLECPARELLTSLAPTHVSERVATAIIKETAGNPLALAGLAGELTQRQLAGQSPLPDPLPASELIEARFARMVRLLPEQTQTTLLLAAAEPSGDLATIDRAAVQLGTSLAAIEPAEAAQLVDTENGIEFRHPLIRSVVYSSATSASRRDAHLALAHAVGRDESERWAMHRALAALGPDEEVAAALEESAVLARARGGYTAEMALLSRSADLSPGGSDRARRLLGGAQAANLSGNSGHAKAIMELVQHTQLNELDRARALLLDGMIRVNLGQGQQAPAVFLEAARSLAPLSRELSRRALLASFNAWMSVGQCAQGITSSDMAKATLIVLDEGLGEPVVDSLLLALASSYASDYSEAISALRSALVTFEHMSAEEITEWYYVAPFIANALWDPDAFKFIVELLEMAARQQGSILALQPALTAAAGEAIREGQFATARTQLSELVDITDAVGGFTPFYALLDVELLAWEGDEELTRPRIRELIEFATSLDSGSSINYGLYATAILELGLGRYSEALQAARLLDGAENPSWSAYALPLIVEAGMRCGEVKAASEALAQTEEHAQALDSPYALGLMWRCKALCADNDETESFFNKAITCIGQSPWRTEVARTHLLFGEWLRRKKRRSDARAELRMAHDMFQSMGAGAFAERAKLELEATGERARARNLQSRTELTARELQIARLAGDGLTSREIASQLFISPHTVEYHLTKVFQKLGVRSRRYLAKALPAIDGNS
jgi:DNA-binding CsgD family transcriptional regulator